MNIVNTNTTLTPRQRSRSCVPEKGVFRARDARSSERKMLLAAALYSNNILVSTPRIETIDPIEPQEGMTTLGFSGCKHFAGM